jgi:hypothetical protein
MAAPPTDGWGPCPSGEFNQLTQRLAARRHRALALTVLAAIVATGATAVAGTAVVQYVWQSTSYTQPAGGCCPSATPTTPQDNQKCAPIAQ